MSQPTLAVKDANAATQTIYTINANGQATMANSAPVTVASDQRAIQVAIDGANVDAFQRLRVGEPRLLLDLKRVGSTPDLLASNAVTGTGAAVYAANRASTMLSVGPAVGTAIRQSKSRAIYQPGKSILVFQTFILAAGQANLRQRVGFFDVNNGIFLEYDGTTLNMVRRTNVTGSPVDNVVAQASWNVDPLTGAGPSGITLDKTKPQILVMDLEWLGVGRVRTGFVIGGQIIYTHQFLNANTALTAVYMSNPNLPVRWENEATDTITGTAGLESICASVNSEGGYDITGITASTDGGSAGKTVAEDTNSEVLALRLHDNFVDVSTAFMQALSVINTTTSAFRWRLVLNPTVTGAGTWNAVTNSVLEKNTTRTVTEDTGIVLASGWASANTNAVDIQQQPVLTLGQSLGGVKDVFSLQIRHLTGSNETFYCSASWREIY